jgi:hypothetical protein
MRSVLARGKGNNTHIVIVAIQTIIAQPNAASVRKQFDRIVDTLEDQFADVATNAHRRQGGPAGRLHVPRIALAQGLVVQPARTPPSRDQAAHRHGRVFLNDQANEGLVTVRGPGVMVESHDDWQVAERRYLSET